MTSARPAPKMRILLSSRRTSPLVFDRTQNQSSASRRYGCRWWPQFRDQPQDVGKHISRDGDLGHLECDVAAMADDLRADFDELLLQVVSDQSLIGSGVARV